MEPMRPRKAVPGDRVAVLSPSLAAPAIAPAVHEQAMRRLADITGLVPVEYPTTRRLGADARDRAADLNAAFADPDIRAVIATVGGEDQITVIPHVDVDAMLADPKPFLGYSDNTHLHNLRWTHGLAGFYGGSTQVHLGAGPGVDAEHAAALRAALLDGGRLELTRPDTSEDHGVDWVDPRALVEFGEREPTGPWEWAGPARAVTGPTWGGCIEVINDMLVAGRFPVAPDAVAGGVLLLESSEEVMSALAFGRILRALGERGVLAAVAGVAVARPPASSFTLVRTPAERAAHRAEQRDRAFEVVARYNPDAVVCVGVPFGHTRPQWIVPYGGTMTLDGGERRVWADYA